MCSVAVFRSTLEVHGGGERGGPFQGSCPSLAHTWAQEVVVDHIGKVNYLGSYADYRTKTHEGKQVST